MDSRRLAALVLLLTAFSSCQRIQNGRFGKSEKQWETVKDETRMSQVEKKPEMKPEPLLDLSTHSEKTVAKAAVPAKPGSTHSRKPASVAPEVAPAATPARENEPGLPAIGAVLASGKGGQCTRIEYPGMGPDQDSFTESQWEKVVTAFNGARGDLERWLGKNSSRFTPQSLATLRLRLKQLQLQRQLRPEEPDLAWRGIGVLTRDSKGTPTLELGGGFAKLLSKHPDRAKFEMTRLVSQIWSPCEVATRESPAPWGAYLRCMKIDEAQSCAAGAQSEAGWAVSSAIARQIAPPGCTIPAFAETGPRECAEKFLVPLTQLSKN